MTYYDGKKPKVEVIKELLKLDYVIGEDKKQFSVVRDFNLPRRVKRFLTPEVTIPADQIKTTVIEDKVIVEGVIVKQVYYVGEDDIVYSETLPPEKFTQFVHINGAYPGNHAQVKVRVEDVRFEIIPSKKYREEEEVVLQSGHHPGYKTKVKQTAILEIFVKVTETVQLEVVTDIIGAHITPYKELVKVQNVIGEGTVQTSVISDVEFPDPVKKIATVDSTFKDVTARVIEDKVIIEGILHKQIYYVEERKGIVKEKSIDEKFTQFIDIPGARPGMNVQIYPRVEFIDHIIDSNDRSIARQTAVIELFVKVTETVQIEVVVGATGVDVYKELFKVENVVGEGTEQLNITAEVKFPKPAKKIANIVASVNITEVKPIDNKVIIKGELDKQVFYVDEETNVLKELTLPSEPFTHFIHIEGVRPGMNVDVTPRVEYTKIDLYDNGLSGRQTAVLELFVKVTETGQIEVVTDVNIPDHDLCPPDASYIIYVVQPGDTLFKIAKRFGISLNDLINANKDTILDPNLIFPGQKIIIPCVPKPKG
ncbi:protein of unknown function [Anaerobranca californiensis DSM 14826]|jgi:hypothetical protein|uniref:Uncharacterized protein n=1 Tax=Anaerobranca californiensis DSM 14826 TaxID=1120989 RepID=A0A1M6PK68_9FIRM|nr:SPOCS domain-containing protein [Anaerobranca californiensis]SHK08339.1 protein of unknown function [Anaerobranca californiensis DSM 14826]